MRPALHPCLVALAFLLLLPTGGAAADPVLHGQVLLEGERPLPGALLELVALGDTAEGAPPPLRTTSGADGRWSLDVPGGGRALLRLHHLATEPLEMEVLLPDSGRLHLELEARPRPLPLAPLHVTAARLPEARAPAARVLRTDPPGQARLDLERFTDGAGLVETGLARSPTAGEPGDPEGHPRDVLYMRGSTVDTRTVHLDGAPILTPFHLAGLLPSFDADMLGRADLHLGGAPAAVDGGLSYVLHVESREPDSHRTGASASVDGVATRLSLHTPLPGEGSLLFATRHLHNTLAGTDRGGTPYTFGDWLQRIAFSPAPGHRLRFTWFENAEGVHLDLPDLAPRERVRPLASRPDAPLSEWGNRALSATWQHDRGDTRWEAVVAGSRYHAGVPVAEPEGQGPGSTMATTRADRRRVAVELHTPLPGFANAALVAGATVQDQALRWELAGDAAPADPVAHARARRLGAFAEARLPLASRLHLRAGGRLDDFGGDDGRLLSPRLALTWSAAEDLRVVFSAGRYREHAPDPGLARTSPEGPGDDAPRMRGWDPRVPVSTADHVVLALDQLVGEGTTLGVSGFFKEFHPVAAPEASPEAGLLPILSAGTDLNLHRRGPRVEGWLGYTMSWFWEEGTAGAPRSGADPDRPSGTEGDRGFEGRHLLSAGLRTDLPGGLRLGVQGNYGAGLPMAAVAPGATGPEAVWDRRGGAVPARVERLSRDQEGTPLPVPRTSRFLRLDLEAEWPTVRQVGGREVELRPHLRVLNALSARDALFHYFDRWADDGLRPAAERPFLPLLGLEVSF